jgi:hypothetical protein
MGPGIRWAVALAVTLAAAVARAGAAQPAPAEPAGRYKVGDTFGQEVVVSRRSTFRVLGTDVSKWAQCALASSFAITEVRADGSLVAEQTVRAGRLIDADPDLRASLAAALEKARGMKLELTVGPAGEVKALKGPKDTIRVLTGNDVAVGQSLRVWSLLDDDAWKELAGLTFFQPEGAPTPEATWARGAGRRTWAREAVHDWGPLGGWRGKTVYAARGRQPGKPGLERYEYGHDIAYQPPAAGSDRGLPLRVLKADFQTAGAGGVILYDPSARRVAAAEETFRVRGAVVVSLGGVEAVVELEEVQGFRLAVGDPAAGAPAGPPPGGRPAPPE